MNEHKFRMYDIITKKKNRVALSGPEIRFMVDGYTHGDIPDSQMAALLMAVCLNGMTKEETAMLTVCMAESGDIVDLSGIPGIKVDKHSTGGVGDKTTLVISPIVAAAGAPVAKMSGRGLGHTGGTVDKLEAIPGLQTGFTRQEFIDIVNSVGVCVAGQSGNLAPADKKIYALRDMTATVDNVSLIAASVMSKKIAAGSDCILLDVKTGSGAFMKTLEDSTALARAMVDIGESAGRKTVALVTDMGIPLGNAVGNSLEMIEAVETLKGNGPKDLTGLCLSLAGEMLWLAGKGDRAQCMILAEQTLRSGAALKKLAEMVGAQHGDSRYITEPSRFERATVVHEIKAAQSGYIEHMDAESIGIASCILGAGRETDKSVIDYSAGVTLKAKTGSYIEKGGVLALLHTSDAQKAQIAEEKFVSSLCFSQNKPPEKPLIYARVDKEERVE